MKRGRKITFLVFVLFAAFCPALTLAGNIRPDGSFDSKSSEALASTDDSYAFIVNDGTATYYCNYLMEYEGQLVYDIDIGPSGKGLLFYNPLFDYFTFKVFGDSYWLSYSQEGVWNGCGSTAYNANAAGDLFQTTIYCGPVVQDCTPPPYNPEKWNDGGAIQRNNNCYNYANDEITMTFAQPGRAHGCYPWSLRDCVGVHDGAQCDGLITLSSGDDPCPGNMHRVYLVVWPNNDYHWYRQDAPDGMWSHKPGGTRATNRDNSGHLIYSPETADTGPYTIHCGYMCACGDNADIE